MTRPSIPGGKFGALGVVFAGMDELTQGNYDRDAVISIAKNYFWGSLGWHTDEGNVDNHEDATCYRD